MRQLWSMPRSGVDPHGTLGAPQHIRVRGRQVPILTDGHGSGVGRFHRGPRISNFLCILSLCAPFPGRATLDGQVKLTRPLRSTFVCFAPG